MDDFVKSMESGEAPPFEQIFAEVLDIAAQDPHVRTIVQQHRAEPADLERIYQNLIANGAGQVARGHFVPASSLCFALTLNYLLAGEASGRSWDEMAWRMVRYFKNREVGAPT